jgi:predicted nucleic acid-binding protein
MRYLDANVFIYAALYEGEKGDKARKLIKKVREGEEAAFTSVLTFDEFFWIVKKERGFDSALEAGPKGCYSSILRFCSWNIYDNLGRW